MTASVRDLLATLVAFDTTSRHSNLELIHWVQRYLESLGVSSRLTFNSDGSKANLFALIGSPEMPAVVLSGHTDVVPVDGQAWQTPPFQLIEHEGKLYGRGSADMKGFIACVLAKVPYFLELANAGRLKQSVGIALSYDEEVGCLGVRGLISDLQQSGIKVSGCIIGEPTDMKPVIAHKGIAHYRCHVSGRAAHSSLTPYGVNAIEYAARLITHIRKLADTEASFGQRHTLYDVPFTTLQTGTIQGGLAPNIVPKDCEFVFECRWLPGDQPERYVDSVREYAASLLKEMRGVAEESDITIEPTVYCPAFEAMPDSDVMQYVQTLTGCCQGEGVAYATEAGLFHEAGMPSVVCGPGSIRQAHRPDEYVDIEQLYLCSEWLVRLGELLCLPGSHSASVSS